MVLLRRENVMKGVAIVLALIFAGGAALHAQAASPTGSVVVTFTVTRSHTIASDQWAAWIEDEKGAFVRTLFVTNFLGRRAGWRIRPQLTPTWVVASNVRNTAPAEIDAVSGATPRDGTVSVTWDLRDREGKVVPLGTYRYRVEGNMFWENTVLWTGTIRVGGDPDSTQATAVYSPPEAKDLGPLITAVGAVYAPAPP
jgi:hypothetical protein